MLYVMAREGFTIRDPERRDRLPAGKWRPVSDTRYWRRLRRDGDVTMCDAEVLAVGAEMPQDGKRYVREEEIEGHSPPAEEAAAPTPEAAAAPLPEIEGAEADQSKTSRKGSAA